LAKFEKHPPRAKVALFLSDKYNEIQAAAAQFPTVPAWLFAAVAIIETGGGQSSIAQNSNNLFNIKALKADIEKGCFYADKKGVKWAKYSNIKASFSAFGRLVTAYDLGEITPQSFAQSKYIAGYNKAQRSRYKQSLQNVIEMYQLKQVFSEK